MVCAAAVEIMRKQDEIRVPFAALLLTVQSCSLRQRGSENLRPQRPTSARYARSFRSSNDEHRAAAVLFGSPSDSFAERARALARVGRTTEELLEGMDAQMEDGNVGTACWCLREGG